MVVFFVFLNNNDILFVKNILPVYVNRSYSSSLIIVKLCLTEMDEIRDMINYNKEREYFYFYGFLLIYFTMRSLFTMTIQYLQNVYA